MKSLQTTAALAVTFIVSATPALAAPPVFSGEWVFDASQSRNAGMMTQVSVHSRITQSPDRIEVVDTSIYQDKQYEERSTYEMGDHNSSNRSPMLGLSTGRSHWSGETLVTEWQRPGAVAGAVLRRIELRRLAPNGRTMIVETRSAGREPMVLVFKRP